MKILIVDDSRAMRMIVRRTLKQAGYADGDITEAGNGVEALDSIREGAPDLVLSDWNMPEMNGLQLLHAVRAEAPWMRFGFVTSEGSVEMRMQAKEAGASFLISKPFTPRSFQIALDLGWEADREELAAGLTEGGEHEGAVA